MSPRESFPRHRETRRPTRFSDLPLEEREEWVQHCLHKIQEYRRFEEIRERVHTKRDTYLTALENDEINCDVPPRFSQIEAFSFYQNYRFIPVQETADGRTVTVGEEMPISRADVLVGRLWKQCYQFDKESIPRAPRKVAFTFQQYCAALDADYVERDLQYRNGMYRLLQSGIVPLTSKFKESPEVIRFLHQERDEYIQQGAQHEIGFFAERTFHSLLIRVFDDLDSTVLLESPTADLEKVDIDIVARLPAREDSENMGIAFAYLRNKQDQKEFLNRIHTQQRITRYRALGLSRVIAAISPRMPYANIQREWRNSNKRKTPDQLLAPDERRKVLDVFFDNYRDVETGERVYTATQVSNALQRAYQGLT